MINKDELVFDRVRSVTAHDPATNEMLLRIASVENGSLQTSAEGEEVVDAVGALITTLYRAKRAAFTGESSLFSLNLAAEQFGAKKQIAGLKDYKFGNEEDATAKIEDYTYEILTIASGKITLAHKASRDIKYIYSIESNEIGKMYKAGAAVSATEFLVNNEGDATEITVPTGLTGKVYVEYYYETDSAVKVSNKASEFPSTVSLVIFAYFRDKCNDNITYSGKIICPRAKLNPESVEIALTTTGKHGFEFTMMKEYCAEDGEDELFSIIVSE